MPIAIQRDRADKHQHHAAATNLIRGFSGHRPGHRYVIPSDALLRAGRPARLSRQSLRTAPARARVLLGAAGVLTERPDPVQIQVRRGRAARSDI